MVICQYFLNNKCQFGNQCKNEHVNVKPVVRNDIDGAIKGNQWLLSCYGPFREKPCVPNFITDQSFEEVRALCYESKTQGNFPTIASQLNQQIIDAKNKMSMLYEFNGDVQNVIVNLHNSGDATRPDTLRSNPFALATTANQSSNLFGSTANSFGNNSNIFGGNSTVKSSGFATTTGNIFGGGSGSGPNSTGSIFGGQQTSNSNGLFATQQNSSFGSGGSGGVGPFSSQSTSTEKGPFSMSQLSKPAEQNPMNVNVFGMANAQTNPVFGGPATFSMKPTGLFNQSAAIDPSVISTANSTNIFGQAFGGTTQQQQPQQQQQQQISQGNIFSSSTLGSPNVFGANQSLFGQPATNSSAGIFSNAQTTQLPNAFGNTVSMANSIFGGAQQTNSEQMPMPSAFVGAQNTAFSTATTSAEQTNIFGAFSSANPVQSSGIFANYQEQQNQQQQQPTQQQQSIQQQQQQPLVQNPFGILNPTTDSFNASPQLVSSSSISSSIYSQLSDLTEEEIAMFKATAFEIGKIPTKPPPKELCV